jgi:hypothetical protein
VDFAGLGWSEEIGPAENNWKIFIDIVTGKGNEDKTEFWSNISNKEKVKPGLNIAIFTSSGNHDWRMHPGSLLPYIGEGECKKFGLTEVEAKNYNYKSFDSSEFPSDERKKMSDALFSKILMVLEKKWWAQYIPGLLVLIGITIKVPEVVEGTSIKYLIFGVLLLLLFISGFFLKIIVRKFVDFIVDNPSDAKAKALHYYFKHINPYFDYAFSFGKNHFILMDTGVDAITVGAKELMDAKDTKYLKKVSVMDNAIGMSPDSMAFDDRQVYYNWSQIVWLDKVLSGISNNKVNTKENIIICVHAPPLNFDYKYRRNLKALSESLGRPLSSPKYVEILNELEYILNSILIKLKVKKSESLGRSSSPKYVEELNELEYILNSILIKLKWKKTEIPLFYWNDVQGTNDKKYLEFLKHDYAIKWIKEAQIEKNGNAIKVLNGQNHLLLQLNDKKTEVELTINNIRTGILIAKPEENNRIYKNNMKRINLTYGTINHYLSQFFFLCRGLHENPNRRIEPNKKCDLKKVDLVLSGHAHVEVEFRIDIEKEKETQEKKVRIYHDEYSKEYPDDFYDSKTFIVQTAACGPHGGDADSPPYWRMVKVNEENRITSFKQENLKKN